MSGRSHRLFTALVVRHLGRTIRHVDVTVLRMRPLDAEAIQRYVERDKPYDCAGSYKLEEGGVALFERIETEDHTAIIGLPLIRLASILLTFWPRCLPTYLLPFPSLGSIHLDLVGRGRAG